MSRTTLASNTHLAPERATPSSDLIWALDRQVHLDARTRQGLSNHLSMELIALDALGAPASRLEEMIDRFVPSALRAAGRRCDVRRIARRGAPPVSTPPCVGACRPWPRPRAASGSTR